METLTTTPNSISIANSSAVERMINADPILSDIDLAYKCIPGFGSKKLVLHAGPPIRWNKMCGAQKGAIIGAIMYEHWSETPEEAEKMAMSGDIKFDACHDHSAVGPMAGVISPNMPVFIVRERATGIAAYANFNEGLGRALRFGAFDKDVIKRLEWMKSTLAPALKRSLKSLTSEKEGILLKPIISQALQMGDECHNRNQAGTSLLLRELVPYLFECVEHKDELDSYNFISSNNHFFLNLVLAASKVMADAATNIQYSTIVTAIARNGTEIGIRVSGLGDKWFTDNATIPDGLYFPGYSAIDANPDMGDSTITETVGLGGAAMAASPSIVRFVGGKVKDALELTTIFKKITIAQHRHFLIPYMDFEGAPTGIDIRKVLRSGITPRANTGIAHKLPGVGQIGAGIVTLPILPFKKALKEYAKEYGI
jgi:Protein of unknown function (DUF1116)